MEINYLLELDQLARQEGKKYSRQRLLYQTLQNSHGKHFTGIIGPRGAGKTVLLKQLLIDRKDAFYISVDTVTSEELFQIAKHLQQSLKIQLLLLDEIHFQKDYDAQLKKIYDSLGLKIIFTSSVALAIAQLLTVALFYKIPACFGHIIQPVKFRNWYNNQTLILKCFFIRCSPHAL